MLFMHLVEQNTWLSSLEGRRSAAQGSPVLFTLPLLGDKRLNACAESFLLLHKIGKEKKKER